MTKEMKRYSMGGGKSSPFKRIYTRAIKKIVFKTVNLWSDRTYLKLFYYGTTGRKLNLTNPKTFCDKINWLKMNYHKEEFSQLVDKVTAKDYVATTIGKQYIIPTIAVYNSVDEIDIEALPDQFVIKCTHDSGGVFICRDKSVFDVSTVKAKIKRSLDSNFVRYTKEYPYSNVKPRIIVEELLTESHKEDIEDYKFYCFNGVAKYCQIIANRSGRETVDFYDRDWLHQPFVGLNLDVIHLSTIERQMPASYDEMLQVADKLASSIDSPFVRIDLYNIKGKIYFGEITFFPASGMGSFYPEEWNEKIGDMIKL